MLGRRPPGTQTSELGFLPATNKRSKNNDGNSGSDSEEDANLFKNDDEVPKIEEK